MFQREATITPRHCRDRSTLGLTLRMQSAQLEEPQRIIKTHNLATHHNIKTPRMLMVGVASGIPNKQMECGGIIGRTSGTLEHPDLAKGSFDVTFRGTVSSTRYLCGGYACSI